MKSTIRRNTILVGSVLSLVLLSVSAQAQNSFTSTYVGQGNNATTCNTTFNIAGQEPTAAGKYPVFVYMVGTGENFQNGSANAAVLGMAQRGFVAATVAYASGSFGNCTQISGKTRCIFTPNSQSSAITMICSRAKADCSKGIVVGGFSQGSVMATLAKNFDTRVEAAWGMGAGVSYANFNLNACMANGNHALPGDRLRIANGQQDGFVARSEAPTVTGLSCGSTVFSCLRANGSGWNIVQNNQVGDGRADHCYSRRTGGCTGNANNLDANWQNGTAAFSLNANLDWLAGFARP